MARLLKNKGKQPPKSATTRNNNNMNQVQTRAMSTYGPYHDLAQFEEVISEADKLLLDVPEKETRFMKRTPRGTRGFYCRHMISITMAKVSAPKSVVRSNHPPFKEHLVRNDRLLFYRGKAKAKKDAKEKKRKADTSELRDLKEREKAALEEKVALQEEENALKKRANAAFKKEVEKRESLLETDK